MDVLLDDQEREISEAIRKFLCESATIRSIRDSERHVRRYDERLWTEFSRLGWTGLCIPEIHGGQGLAPSYLVLLAEALGYSIAPLPAMTSLCGADVISRFGAGPMREQVLPGVVDGSLRIGTALVEPDGVWGGHGVRLSASREGDHLRIEGEKLFAAGALSADVLVVGVRLASTVSPASHPILVLVDRDTPGLGIEPLLPLAKDDESRITFTGVRVPMDRIIGSPDDPTPFEWLLDLQSLFLAAQMQGAARRMLELAVEYTKGRDAFGQPIAAFQSMQHLAADMVNAVDGSQLLCREAGWRLAQGLPARVEVSQAKAFASERCVMVARSAQQMHGGIGFIAEFDLNLWYRRIVSWSLRGGTAIEHRDRVASALFDRRRRIRLGMTLELPPSADRQVIEPARRRDVVAEVAHVRT